MIDRLKELQENIERHNDDEDVYIHNHFAVINMEVLFTTDFFKEVNELRDSINQTAQLIDDVDHLQQAMLAPQVFAGTKQNLEKKMNEIKSLGHHIRMKIQHLKYKQDIHNPTGKKDARQRIVDEQTDAITKCFCSIMSKYHQSIMTYRERCIQRIQRQNELIGVVRNDDEIEDILENKHLSLYPDIIIETRQNKGNLDLMKLRHQELFVLENGMQEMNDMFFDIAYLIESQSDQIKTIAERTKLTEDYVIKIQPLIGAKKVSLRFHSKLYRNECITRLAKLCCSCACH